MATVKRQRRNLFNESPKEFATEVRLGSTIMTTPFNSELTHSSIVVDKRMQEMIRKQAPTGFMMRRDATQSNVRVISVTVKVD